MGAHDASNGSAEMNEPGQASKTPRRAIDSFHAWRPDLWVQQLRFSGELSDRSETARICDTLQHGPQSTHVATSTIAAAERRLACVSLQPSKQEDEGMRIGRLALSSAACVGLVAQLLAFGDQANAAQMYAHLTYAHQIDVQYRVQQFNRQQFNRQQFNRQQFNRQQFNRQQFNQQQFNQQQFNRQQYNRRH
jgi:hypothetical protein